MTQDTIIFQSRRQGKSRATELALVAWFKKHPDGTVAYFHSDGSYCVENLADAVIIE